MRIGVLGTGMVGEAIATKLVELGHEVRMGSRTDGNPTARAWAERAGAGASEGDFAAAAAYGDVVVNCTSGEHSVAVLDQAGADALDGKVLVDVANPLAFGDAGPHLFVSGTDSLAERLQRAHPETKVVKSLNTMNCDVMVDPALVPGDHVVFLSSDHDDAKAQVSALLAGFGWREGQIVDLGELSTARGTESYLLFWLRVMQATGTSRFNVAIQR